MKEIERGLTTGAEENLAVKDRITKIIESIFCDEEYGFEAYVTMKDGTMKRFLLYQGPPVIRNDLEKNFKRKMQVAMADAVKEKYTGTDVEYDSAYNIADNQQKIYVVQEDAEYHPFECTRQKPEQLDCLSCYSADERENVVGMLFSFFRQGQPTVWAFQYLYQNAIPNRKKEGFQLFQKDDVFVEFTEPLLLISKRIDLLVIEKEIISDKITLLQSHFGFEEFVRVNATRVANTIATVNLVSNPQKMIDYVERSKSTYAKKMMRIRDSKVLRLSAEELYSRIATLPRWRGKFKIDEESKKVVLENYTQVENLIDLFDERYTRSDVTGEEYDTSAKKPATPIATDAG